MAETMQSMIADAFSAENKPLQFAMCCDGFYPVGSVVGYCPLCWEKPKLVVPADEMEAFARSAAERAAQLERAQTKMARLIEKAKGLR